MYKKLLEQTSIAKRIEELTIELTEVLSVTETKGEIEVSKKVYELLNRLPYYQENPENLYIQDIPTDKFGRKNVIAIVKGKSTSNKAVALLGHTDTVGISDYGNLASLCTTPYELTEKMAEIKDNLPQSVQIDIEAKDEDYLFGRGIFDMKSGNAVIMALIEAITMDIENFDGNLIYMAVCDEETNSTGMFAAVPELNKLARLNEWDIQGLIDTDYMTNDYEGDDSKYIYIGTVGKLMPSFYVVGSETHVGEPFNGLDPNEIVAELTREINLNPAYCDIAEGQVTLPPVTLKQRDLKPEYSVQIAKTATVFFNYATHCSTPDQVLEKMLAAAEKCMDEVLDTLAERYEMFCNLSNIENQGLPWKTKVISYDDLIKEVRLEIGEVEFEEVRRKIEGDLLKEKNLDERDFSLAMVEKIHTLWSYRDPVIVVYFTPPYYPHILVEGKNKKEKNMLKAVEKAMAETVTDYPLVLKKFFPYIADISFASAPQDANVVENLKGNMPGFGSKYIMPIEEMQKLNVPVLDIGPFGKDAHKYTERVETNYSFNVTPEVVFRTIIELLK